MKKQIIFGNWEFEQLITDIVATSITLFIEETGMELSEEKQEELFDKLEKKIKFKVDNLEEFKNGG